DEQARSFNIGVPGRVDERQMELATAFGHFSRNERRYEQGWGAPFLALCFDQRRGCEPIYCFDLGPEAMLTTLNQEMDYGVRAMALALCGSRRVDFGVNSGGPLERLSGSLQEPAFSDFSRHGSTRSVHHFLLYTLREH